MPRMNRPGCRSSILAKDPATSAASSFQMLTMLVPTTSALVVSSSSSTMARSPSGEPPSQSAPYPSCSSSAAIAGVVCQAPRQTPNRPSRSRHCVMPPPSTRSPLARTAGWPPVFPCSGSWLQADDVGRQFHLLVEKLGSRLDHVVELAEKLEADDAEQLCPACHRGQHQRIGHAGRDISTGPAQVGPDRVGEPRADPCGQLARGQRAVPLAGPLMTCLA